ncbi:MAG: hypothetical protein R2783_07045 [Gelidibacter sp.]
MKARLIILIALSLSLSLNIHAQDKNKMLNVLMGKGKSDTSKLPDTYQFQWEFKTIMKMSNNEEMNMDYLINPNNDYFRMQLSSEEYKQMEFMCMVMDPNWIFLQRL